MSLGSRIKELRENKRLSRIELAELLGVTVGSISNYENEISSPKESILFKLMEILDCDANYLFQDAIHMPAMKNSVSVEEYRIIEKYRFISKYSPLVSETISELINDEYDIVLSLKNKDLYITELESKLKKLEENNEKQLDNDCITHLKSEKNRGGV